MVVFFILCLYQVVFSIPFFPSIYRALVKSMGEILFSCGSYKRAVIATLTTIGHDIQGSEDSQKDEVN